ncbi:hypothetical protein J0895_03835 [Phormidium pseudopriestleyi FRX01]|uniref:Cytotoxic translational repressor of toxin-antitoxin stability system n=1 Tax=Phormidium pseudopriestleyi FRX01 TaxID=1759528 RepID=A0ABS3FMD6_9CYAN|nr:hypothetical protein [Phormidium pseudopriestleyi]MBO0348245.1 hypothetical protein [Phormidium pseudopriestleyi FRX01]
MVFALNIRKRLKSLLRTVGNVFSSNIRKRLKSLLRTLGKGRSPVYRFELDECDRRGVLYVTIIYIGRFPRLKHD